MLVVFLILGFVLIKPVTSNQTPASRLWLEYTMDIVRETKPAPTESARLYAAVSTLYYENLKRCGEGCGNIAVKDFLNLQFPEFSRRTKEFVEKNKFVILQEPKNSPTNNQEINEKANNNYVLVKNSVLEIQDKIRNENSIKEKWRPLGNKYNEFWYLDGKPFTPSAGQWERWQLGKAGNDFNYIVPQPPKYGSAEFLEKLKEVKVAADLRTSEQGAIINFWGGVPGTEQPAGIWLNRLWDETKNQKKFFIFPKYTNEEYAKVQMHLAQALSDSFMECWKVKFEYNTKRPSMAADVFAKQIGGEINLAMPNPPFASYTSGHSTISATAATVLCELIKDKCVIWQKNATDAKNSRLWAGIHFSYDNDEGEKLGKAVGEYYVNNILK